MDYSVHRADTRGKVDFGWLKSHHSFSFGSYYNPARVHFGALRVLNDDEVAGSKGFDTHRHENMEIISIPLSGDLIHRDSLGTESIIKEGDIQVMSAGRGISHSEYNNNPNIPVRFVQIWIIPNQRNVTPRYDQISLTSGTDNILHQILSPSEEDEGVWIYQDAWMHLGKYSEATHDTYNLRKPN